MKKAIILILILSVSIVVNNHANKVETAIDVISENPSMFPIHPPL